MAPSAEPHTRNYGGPPQSPLGDLTHLVRPIDAVALPANSHRMSILRAAIALAVFALFICTASSAKADLAVAADVDVAAPIDSEPLKTGGGVGARVGYHAHIPLFVLTPEVIFSYYGFGGDSPASVYRGLGGARLAIGEIIRPGIFGHMGVGQMEADGSPAQSYSAFTYDAGLFLDFTLLPILNVGIHGAYHGLSAGGEMAAVGWAAGGGHVEFVF